MDVFFDLLCLKRLRFLVFKLEGNVEVVLQLNQEVDVLVLDFGNLLKQFLALALEQGDLLDLCLGVQALQLWILALLNDFI